jgi:hypothetical protein
MISHPFTVILSPEQADELDSTFSPMDGIVAIDNVCLDLPEVHQPRACDPADPNTPYVYTGRLAWYPLGFSYVQAGHELHMLDFWFDDDLGTSNRSEVDSVIGLGSA